MALTIGCWAQGHGGIVFLVRHAEKASNAKDALLTDEGHQRAQCLGHLLADADIHKIFATEVTRTQQTADPLSTILGLQPVIMDPYDIKGILAQLQSDTDENILVVAHSDTLPHILEGLGARKTKILKDEFDRLFVFRYDDSGKQGTVTTLRYCDCK
jgi:broad specificity phosphatase PhoE